MTPKEKAVQLFNKYYVSILEVDHDLSQEILISILAKKQSLIAVDEIISTFAIMGLGSKFYEYVKTELTNL
jgi:hypothetical protein